MRLLVMLPPLNLDNRVVLEDSRTIWSYDLPENTRVHVLMLYDATQRGMGLDSNSVCW
jgi:hypothetical protein